ncbi:MAG: nucleotidyltransferase domain-containing protein [Spirochaetota bacterium]
MQKKYSNSVRIFYPRYGKEEIVKKINQRLTLLKSRLPVLSIVLFGSYATGSYTAASDIDVLVVYRGEQNDKAFQIVKETLGIPGVEPHVYTDSQALEMSAIIQKMIQNSVTLYQY